MSGTIYHAVMFHRIEGAFGKRPRKLRRRVPAHRDPAPLTNPVAGVPSR